MQEGLVSCVKQIVYNINTQRLTLMRWVIFNVELYRSRCYEVEVWRRAIIWCMLFTSPYIHAIFHVTLW